MNLKIELKSLSINKTQLEEGDFEKYNIDVTIDEMESTDSYTKLQFSITFLSDPKNIKIFFDGLVTITANESQRQDLEKNEDGIPVVLHKIYDELFPIIFMMTKTANVPSPSIRLSESHEIMSQPNTQSSELFNQENSQTDKKEKPEKPPEIKPDESSKQKTDDVSEQSFEEDKETSDDDYDNMSSDELNKLYEQLDKEYSDNPSQETQQKLEKIIQAMQNKNNAEQE